MGRKKGDKRGGLWVSSGGHTRVYYHRYVCGLGEACGRCGRWMCAYGLCQCLSLSLSELFVLSSEYYLGVVVGPLG